MAVEAAADRDWQRIRVDQGLTYSLAQLLGVAVSNPRRMPKFDRVFPDRQRARVHPPQISPDEAMQNLKLWAAAIEARDRRKTRREV